ncbi:MAG: hypothetical protein ACO3MW_08990 [Rhodospirillales bacterium]|jgi:hypothetical protein
MTSITRFFSLRILVLIAGIVALLALSACSGYGIAEVVSTTSTGKTIPDHVISLGSGRDCSTARYQRGHHYCKEDEKNLQQTNLYCYPTLGTTTCYDRPNPYDPRVPVNNRDKHNQGKPAPQMPPMDFLRPKYDPDEDHP